MTLYEFIQADEAEQAEATLEGVHIGNRFDEEHNILLYQINSTESFYVEVYHHIEHGVIKRFRPFKSLDQLAPYLERMKIDI